MENNNEVLLRVEHLCQYFPMGAGRELKAVDDVNFEIKKGEVFGLVGESGCGKTTTGRSIIKLYDITSGNVYFKGQRICAGIRSYQDAIRAARAERKQTVAELKKACAGELAPVEATDEAKKTEIKEKYAKLIAEENEKCAAIVSENKTLKYAAAHDQKYCDRDYAEQVCGELEKERDEALAKHISGEEAKALTAKYRADLAAAKAERKSALAGLKTAGEGENEEKKAEIERAFAEKKAKFEEAYAPAAARKACVKEYREKLRLASRERIVNRIQMIFQDPIASLDPRMTIRNIVSEGLIIKGVKDKDYIDEKVYEILEKVGLVRDHANRYPHEFSGGQRQRIGIARSVIMEPELIIADEPVSALDVSIQAQVINLLNDLRSELGISVLFIAHDLSVVKYFSDRIGVMYFGKMVELAPSDELFAHPLHPYTRSLLSAIPLPDPEYEKGRERLTYNPIAEHDYSVEKPSMREITDGHFIYCNGEEFEKYKKELGIA